LVYDGSGNTIWTGWSGGTSSYNQTCSGNPAQAQ
jgi:hypothetical protein